MWFCDHAINSCEIDLALFGWVIRLGADEFESDGLHVDEISLGDELLIVWQNVPLDLPAIRGDGQLDFAHDDGVVGPCWSFPDLVGAFLSLSEGEGYEGEGEDEFYHWVIIQQYISEYQGRFSCIC